MKEGLKMEKVSLQVNVINQLKLLRQSTFKDILCFLDEDIQNAQRAKATVARVSVNTHAKQVVIANNGQVLSNPQALFSIAESEWDEDIKNTENPFGMGFFSNITVSDLIQIRSGNNLITFDVANMINTNDTEIKVEVVDTFYDGFELTLNNFDFESARNWDIEERVSILGKYIQGLDIYFNDELQPHKDLTEGDNSLFQNPITEQDLQGWIALDDNYSWGDNLNVFYKGRLVCKLENMPYLKGDLHISDKVLNLTSPDRKDIIKDKKLTDFKVLIKLYAEKLCNNTVLSYSENIINNYTNSISYYVNKKEIKNLLKFMTFRTNDEKDYAYLTGIALAKIENNSINNFNDYEIFLKKEATKQSESHFESVDIIAKQKSLPKEAFGEIYHASRVSHENGYVEIPKINEDELAEVNGEIILNNSEPVFYIGFNDVLKFEYKLNVAKHYNLKIIVARNKIEESILGSMKDSDNVFHISELDETITISGNISNTTLSIKEQRAMMLFDMISRIIGLDHNAFSIGDLIVYRNIKSENLNVNQDLIDENIVVLKDDTSKKIYVDRSIINQNNLREDVDEKLDINDYKFILSNISNIVAELSLLTNKSDKDNLSLLLTALGNCNNS